MICDYATRYPKAVPLHHTDAQHVAEELFSRVGVPLEILTDQGSNFTSKLLSKVYTSDLSIPVRTTPKPMRGPMDVLRETWEAREDSEESVVSHVLLMQERLAKMTGGSREGSKSAKRDMFTMPASESSNQATQC